MADHDDLTTVATFINPAEAHLAKSRLELEGIEACLLDEDMGNIFMGLLIGSTGGIRLQVHESDTNRAQAILESDAEDSSPGQ
jgi:hypothetical protein